MIVMPGPSGPSARDGAVAGREAAAGPRLRSPPVPAEADCLVPPGRTAPPRPGAADGREVERAPVRRAPDAATGRLVDRGAPGRLLLMR
ncbi:hypothetical protein BCONGLO52_25190 [Brachybacterium conglomeratum]|uniref:Uncharacterized protein n=1 Tax=Brachybacterium conglomeratum TaxID=47846 RepID=A0ABQ5RII0_9MICO|nr:hypothetical protein BCONGLO52_25190 [Brachybacterium conglomeratum]GLK03211.1 hypothetical protein GCM10017597_00100 [Brachybacterium conglomeratum]